MSHSTEGVYPVHILEDTYLTELTGFGCAAILEEPATSVYYTRSYHNGTLQYGEHSLQAKFINYFSGNMKVLSIQGEGAQELLGRLSERKKRHAIPLMLRMLMCYIYCLASPLMGTITLFLLLTTNWIGALKGCGVILILRFLYVMTRNHLR